MAGVLQGKDIADGTISAAKLIEGTIIEDVYLTGDLSVTGSTLSFTFGTITCTVTKDSQTEASISITSSVDISITLTSRLSGNNALTTTRTTYALVADTAQSLGTITLGSLFIAEYWVKLTNQLYYITSGANSAYSDCWIDIETKHLSGT